MKFKKISSIIIALAMTISASGCASNEKANVSLSSSVGAVSAVSSSEAMSAPEASSAVSVSVPESSADAASSSAASVSAPASSSEVSSSAAASEPASSSAVSSSKPASSAASSSKPESSSAVSSSKPASSSAVSSSKPASSSAASSSKPASSSAASSSSKPASTSSSKPQTPPSGGNSGLIPQLSLEQKTLPQSEALDFVRKLKLGWDLGNTFDAIDCTWLSNEMDYESAWNGAKTTKQHIRKLKEAGFNAVRIPVSWHNHLTDKNNYTISKAWLDRVNEVVDYCIENDMYVIINIHHDNSKEFMYPSSAYLNQSLAYVTAIWKQLCERFKNYDEHLIFNALNEPRLVGHTNEWWMTNNADVNDAVACINKLNQAFVDTVRASGGKNATRYLLCPGYCASPDGALNSGFVLPTDPNTSNKNRIMVSVHAYTPYNFALEDYGTDKWSSSNSSDVKNMVGFMDKLYNKFVSKGIPVVIDEFGARNKNENLASRVDFAAYYIAAARARGISCFWWDNNAFSGSGENFGLLDRKTCEWRYPEIVQAMVKYAS